MKKFKWLEQFPKDKLIAQYQKSIKQAEEMRDEAIKGNKKVNGFTAEELQVNVDKLKAGMKLYTRS